jgi:hypothetical protein
MLLCGLLRLISGHPCYPFLLLLELALSLALFEFKKTVLGAHQALMHLRKV